MKNLEILGSVSEDSAIAEMEVLTPIIPGKEKAESTIDAKEQNGVVLSESFKDKEPESDIKSDSKVKISEEKENKDGVDLEDSESSKVNRKSTVEENSSVEANSKIVNGGDEECNGDASEDVSVDKSEEVSKDKTLNGDIEEDESVNDKQVKEDIVDVKDSESKPDEAAENPDSSPFKVSDNAQEDSDINGKEEVFKMPNTIEELLDEEVLKDDSEVPEIDRDEVFNEIETAKKDTAEEMEVDRSSVTEVSMKKDEVSEESKFDKNEPKPSGVEAMETSDTEKLMSEEKVGADEDSKDPADNASKEVINPFVDETSPESDDDVVKEGEKKEEVESNEKENPSQISLESVDQGASEEENSDDDLDINAGLDKCFSALEKEISKDEPPAASTPSTVNNLAKKLEETKKDSVKAIDVDDSSRDVSNVPSEAEEGGNEADDEGERMGDPEVPEEPVDLDQALGELEMIEKTTRRILDDESESLKRPSEETTEPASKKVKIDESLEETVEAVKKKKMKKELKKMSRNDLEDMIANKMVEVMTNKSEIGKLRHQCDSFQESVEKWKRRAQALSKQCTDLSTVMRKYITDSKSRPRDKVAPVRITRSVGLQVMTPDQRRLQQQRQNQNRSRTQDKAVAPGAVQKATPAKTPVSNGTAKHTNGLANTTTPQLPRTVGGTTISPAKTTATPIRNTGSVTITQTKNPSTTSSTPKPVIDIVDLSDDESTPTPPPPKPAPQPVRQVPSGLVRSSGPRQQGQQFIMQGNQLYPVRQQQGGMARQNMQGHRPMMGNRPRAQMRSVHPAPLPPMPNPQPNSPNWKLLPPRPALKISRVNNGIVLSWNMNLNLATHATIASYQLYAYQESAMQRPDSSLWKKVGDVKALPLPMACTLTQFTRGNKYHFAVRAMDGHSRVGQFSDPNSIVLN